MEIIDYVLRYRNLGSNRLNVVTNHIVFPYDLLLS